MPFSPLHIELNIQLYLIIKILKYYHLVFYALKSSWSDIWIFNILSYFLRGIIEITFYLCKPVIWNQSSDIQYSFSSILNLCDSSLCFSPKSTSLFDCSSNLLVILSICLESVVDLVLILLYSATCTWSKSLLSLSFK